MHTVDHGQGGGGHLPEQYFDIQSNVWKILSRQMINTRGRGRGAAQIGPNYDRLTSTGIINGIPN